MAYPKSPRPRTPTIPAMYMATFVHAKPGEEGDKVELVLDGLVARFGARADADSRVVAFAEGRGGGDGAGTRGGGGVGDDDGGGRGGGLVGGSAAAQTTLRLAHSET